MSDTTEVTQEVNTEEVFSKSDMTLAYNKGHFDGVSEMVQIITSLVLDSDSMEVAFSKITAFLTATSAVQGGASGEEGQEIYNTLLDALLSVHPEDDNKE